MKIKQTMYKIKSLETDIKQGKIDRDKYLQKKDHLSEIYEKLLNAATTVMQQQQQRQSDIHDTRLISVSPLSLLDETDSLKTADDDGDICNALQTNYYKINHTDKFEDDDVYSPALGILKEFNDCENPIGRNHLEAALQGIKVGPNSTYN